MKQFRQIAAECLNHASAAPDALEPQQLRKLSMQLKNKSGGKGKRGKEYAPLAVAPGAWAKTGTPVTNPAPQAKLTPAAMGSGGKKAAPVAAATVNTAPAPVPRPAPAGKPTKPVAAQKAP
ncbi:hypothetical protein OEZ85_005817 [Tetradesmus obliquus]|uniref:Uncharacterized protein n=1 Tax=Tetradesmus obliquus TaxID=3088 RepID=A0ABY8UGX9_TETOB|nr:hypothetical protein OEZ85_005817 [Tetradesmus obliquus]